MTGAAAGKVWPVPGLRPRDRRRHSAHRRLACRRPDLRRGPPPLAPHLRANRSHRHRGRRR
ncbi:hypothetical protein ACU686_39980 [Yinghuangia aomiensis]